MFPNSILFHWGWAFVAPDLSMGGAGIPGILHQIQCYWTWALVFIFLSKNAFCVLLVLNKNAECRLLSQQPSRVQAQPLRAPCPTAPHPGQVCSILGLVPAAFGAWGGRACQGLLVADSNLNSQPGAGVASSRGIGFCSFSSSLWALLPFPAHTVQLWLSSPYLSLESNCPFHKDLALTLNSSSCGTWCALWTIYTDERVRYSPNVFLDVFFLNLFQGALSDGTWKLSRYYKIPYEIFLFWK